MNVYWTLSIQVKISYIKEHHREIVLHQINDIVRQLNDNSRKTPIVTFPPDIHQPLDLQNSTPAKLNACQVSRLMNLRNKFVISGTISFYKGQNFYSWFKFSSSRFSKIIFCVVFILVYFYPKLVDRLQRIYIERKKSIFLQ